MKKLRFSWIVVALIMAIFTGASADDQQNALVVDNASLFKDKLSEVTLAAQGLQNKGADVHIWTIPSFSGEASTLEGYYKKLEQNFPAWQSAEGKRKNNLVVLMIAMKERKAGLYYGGEWSRPLEKNWLRIQTDFMNPKFKRGEFAEGFIAGTGEIARVLDEHLHPSQASPPQTVVIQPQAPSKPIDLSGLWTVMMWGLGLACICFIGFFGVRTFSNRQEEQAKQKRAQQRAKIEKGNAAERITSIRSAMNNLETLVAAVMGAIDNTSIQLLKGKFQQAKDAQAKLAADFTGTGNTAGDPNVDGLAESQYAAMEDKYKEVIESSGEVLSAIRKLEEEVIGFRDLAMNAPKIWKDLEQKTKEVGSAIEALKSKGFKIEGVSQSLDKILKLSQQAKLHLDEKRYEKFSAAAQEVVAQLDDINERVLSIPTLKQKIDKVVDELEIKVLDVTKLIGEAKPVFTALTNSFVPRSWEPVKGNGTEAENRVKQASVAIASIRVCASMDVQDWEQGLALAEKAGQALDQAQSLVRSIFSLKDNLELAKASVAKEVADAESDIKKARTFIKQSADDIRGNSEDYLRKAALMIDKVKKELENKLPDYTTALKMAQEANALADKAYDWAVEECELADRRRKKLASQKQSAKRRVLKATEYLEDHQDDIGSEAKDYLSAAQNSFQRAEKIGDLDKAIALMLSAEESADNAYNAASDDVKNAQRSHSRSSWGTRHEDNSTNILLVGGYSDGHHDDERHNDGGGWTPSVSSSESSSGGGDTSFSGGDFGGGGDTSFSGGDFGGGGDSSW